MESHPKPNGAGRLLHYWPIIVVAAAALVGYGTLQNRVATAEEKVKDVESKQESQAAAANADSRVLVQVATEQKLMKEQVEAINEKLDRLLERR